MEQEKILACIGLAFAIISVFVATLIFAPIAIIFGYFAMKKGEERLGRLALMLGLVLTLLNLGLLIVQNLA